MNNEAKSLARERSTRHPLVSIIIVSFNRREDLRICLRSVEGQAYRNLSTIVIDNGSTDGTVKAIPREFPWVKFYSAAGNLGACIARNTAVRLSAGRYLWFLDSDTEIVDDGLACQLVENFQNDPRLGAIGGEAVLDGTGRIIGTKRLMLERNGTIRGEFLLDVPFGELVHTDTLASCNLFMRRETFELIKGFDPQYFIYYEDNDLVYRIQRLGLDLKVLGKVPVIHKFSDTSRKRNIWLPSRNRAYFVIKNFPVPDVLLLPLQDVLFLFNFRNVGRLKERARKIDLGERGFVRHDAPQAGSQLQLSQLARASYQALRFIFSLFGGYFLVLPYLGRALRARRSSPDFLAATDPNLVREVTPSPQRTTA